MSLLRRQGLSAIRNLRPKADHASESFWSPGKQEKVYPLNPSPLPTLASMLRIHASVLMISCTQSRAPLLFTWLQIVLKSKARWQDMTASCGKPDDQHLRSGEGICCHWCQGHLLRSLGATIPLLCRFLGICSTRHLRRLGKAESGSRGNYPGMQYYHLLLSFAHQQHVCYTICSTLLHIHVQAVVHRLT